MQIYKLNKIKKVFMSNQLKRQIFAWGSFLI